MIHILAEPRVALKILLVKSILLETVASNRFWKVMLTVACGNVHKMNSDSFFLGFSDVDLMTGVSLKRQ